MGSFRLERWIELRRAWRLAPALVLVLAGLTAPGAEAASRKSRAATPRIAASIVVDMNTGSILHVDAADTPRHPASLTKMMTLYVLFGYMRAGKITPDSELLVTPHAASQAPTKLGLKAGATIKVSDAAKALVTQSANDAATTIAENLGGTEENFARVMSDTARRLGMTRTVFRNASGLPNDEQITTARDMATLAAHLIHDYPEFYGVFETRHFSFKGRRYRNHNKLLFGYKGTDGIKTGYTRASGFNLAASVHRGNKHLLAVVLGGRTGSQRDAATRGLLDKHFAEGVGDQAHAGAAHRVSGRRAAAAAPGDQEAGLGAGGCGTGSGSGRSSRPRRYRRADFVPKSARCPERPAGESCRQAGSLRRCLSRPGRGLYVAGRGRKPARHGPAARRQPAGRTPALHHVLHEREPGVVPGAVCRLLAGRCSSHLCGAEKTVPRLRGHARRVAARVTRG